ncbi:MAG: DRTGG domain-containing protein [Chloroflexi bacterium]|nr:DRTGG domain-containing protein [Chloroflexota bacterium]
MRRIYLGSTEPRVGKTVIASALARLAGDGAAFRATAPKGNAAEPEDTRLFPPDPANDISQRFQANIDAARATLSNAESGAELSIIDGTGLDGGRVDAALAEALDADLWLVLWYDEHSMGEGDVSSTRTAAGQFGDRLSRIIINAVPELRMHYVESTLLTTIADAGLPPASAIKQDGTLSAPTMREIVEHLEADVVAYPEGLDVLVPRVMVGALALDGGIYYYGQADEKIVLTRWDRPDLQMPAMATGCQGLILTGGQGPIPYVQNRVDELQIPVAVVPGGTVATATRLSDGALGGRGQMHPDKIAVMASQLQDSSLAQELLAVSA